MSTVSQVAAKAILHLLTERLEEVAHRLDNGGRRFLRYPLLATQAV